MPSDALEMQARAPWGGDIEPILERLDADAERLVARTIAPRSLRKV